MQQEHVKRRDSGEVVVSSIVRNVSGFVTKALELNLTQVTGIVFILYSCNSFFGLPMFDSQPFPFLIALFFLGVRLVITRGEFKTPNIFIGFAVLFLFGITIGFFTGFQFNMLFIRGLVGYFSIVVLMMAFYEYIRLYGFPLNLLIFMNVVWIIVGILQLVEPNIVSAFVADRTSPGRGVTSLGPEPSSFGIQLFFFSWIYMIVTDYKPNSRLIILIALNLLAIFFLAISALTVAFLFVSFIFFLVYNFKSLFSWRNFALLTLTIIAVVILVNYFLSGSRMERLFNQMLTLDFETLLSADRSVNSRLAHQLLPIYMFLNNLGMPVGLQPLASGVADLPVHIREFLWGNISDDKIMSWNATLIYEMGLFGVFIWILIFQLFTDGSMRRIVELGLLFVLLFSSIPLSYPLIPMILTIMYMTNKRFIKKRVNNTLVS